MKHLNIVYPALLPALAMFLFGCNNPPKQPSNQQQVDSVKLKQDKLRLDEALKKLDVPSQIFNAPGDQLSLIKGKKGTVIFLTPNDLETEDGKAPGSKVVVELKEITNVSELARTNAQTVSNSRLLISGGAYYLNMTSDGKQLKIKAGKSLKIAFPRITDSSMTLFYGGRDSAGQMNWQPTNEPLSSKNGYSVDTRDTGDGKSIMVYNPKSYKLMGYVGSENTFRRDTATLNTMKRRRNDSLAEIRIKQEIQDSISREKMKPYIQSSQKLNENLYDITNIKTLGWINCDRLYPDAEKTNITYTIDPKDSITYARVYIVYRQINSVISYNFFNNESTGTRYLDGVPVGYQARMIAVAVRNDELLTSKMDMTVVKNQHSMIQWKKTTTEELNSYFDPNNNWGQ